MIAPQTNSAASTGTVPVIKQLSNITVNNYQERQTTNYNNDQIPSSKTRSNQPDSLTSILDQDYTPLEPITPRVPDQDYTPLEPITPRVPDCKPQGKDALSALDRAKTDECKQKIHDTICLSQANKLYNVSLKNLCPMGKNPAKSFKFVPYSEGKGPNIRIVFLMSIHGRATREVKRLFKAVYHSDHYYYIHVDYVSYML